MVVYERGNQVGGTWVYTPETESDLLGRDPARPVVQSSLYWSLRTNLSREAMGFRDYPFVTRADWSSDSRRFPGHTEVLAYLKGFARDFAIEEMVRFGREVVKVGLFKGSDRSQWRVKSRKATNGICSGDDEEDDVFDAVVVCNGHYTQPRLAEIPGKLLACLADSYFLILAISVVGLCFRNWCSCQSIIHLWIKDAFSPPDCLGSNNLTLPFYKVNISLGVESLEIPLFSS